MLSLGIDSGELVTRTGQMDWAMPLIVIGQFWTIGVELVFYALAPLLVRSRWRVAAVFALSISGMLEQGWIGGSTFLDLSPVVTLIRAPSHLWMFMLGAALAHLHETRGYRDGLVVTGMYAMIAWKRELFPMAVFPWWMFTAITASVPVLFTMTKDNRFDRAMGELSYPVYINHFIVIQVFGTLFGANGLLFASMSVLMAFVTVRLVERPIQWLKLSHKPTLTSSKGHTI